MYSTVEYDFDFSQISNIIWYLRIQKDSGPFLKKIYQETNKKVQISFLGESQ